MNASNPFSTTLRVRGYELDVFGHVNNAVYLNYFEHCRWEAFGQLGSDARKSDAQMVVRKLSVEYMAAAYLFDEIEVTLWIERLGRTSATFGQSLRRVSDGQVLASAEFVMVTIDATGRPVELPEWLREQYQA
ncbi:acyl-CoA thioesterase [Lujinxingia sediminis]|uniref:Acyl-CoA thioesterase n=1 Tax=Lujinxingia sediminis TaxID=2480984 RepID=A0ABY0CQU3_9DELT|nr:thioesterase family protein [Lujinxingia sediminis]RVU42896.1 acyl-CoA thioesterase [Lujinxingia sediminis]